jgi:hypothetical protein
MEGSLYRLPRSRRQRVSRRRQFHNGRRRAVVRAITAGRFYLARQVPSIAAAAEACGSNILYVQAAVALLKSESDTALRQVLTGHASLLKAAAQTRRLAELVSAWRNTLPEQRAEFGRTVGVAE